MATTEDSKQVQAKEIFVPEWEHVASGKSETNTDTNTRPAKRNLRTGFVARLDRALPPHRRYLRLSRNAFLLVCAGIMLALLALIIGLAAGLSHKKSDDLPLPSNSQAFTGQLTYYTPGLGACGETNVDSDPIVAVSHLLFDAAGSSSSTGGNSNSNPLCNKMIRAQRYDEQVGAMRSVDLKVVDRCVGCKENDLDTTIDMFGSMAAVASGRVDVTWAWLQPEATGK